jgi:hypothetical protein
MQYRYVEVDTKPRARIPEVAFERDTVVVIFEGNHFTFATPIENFDSFALKAKFGFDRVRKMLVVPDRITSTLEAIAME